MITHPASSLARAGEPSQPIANYGLLADCNSAALVDSDGSIDWLCLPRYDSDAVFARLLDPDAGHWSIRPVQSYRAKRRYLPGTLVIETIFTTETGQVRLTDAMAFAEGQRGHDLGYDAPHELLRSVEGLSGEVELELELAPRPQYGLVMPLVRLEEGGARTFGAGRIGVQVRRAARGRGLDDPRDVHRRRGRPTGLLRSLGVRRGPERARAHGRGRGRRAHRRHRRGLAFLGGRARHLRGAAPRARPDELAGAEGAQLPAHRRDRRRAHDLAARDGRRRAQLGLPLLLDPRLEPDDRGALHRHLLRRGGGVRLLHDQLGGRPRGRGLAPDHVRHRRRARPLGARASAPARLARVAPGPRGQRRLGPGPARRLRRAPQLALALPREARRAASRDPGLRGRPRRHRRAPLDRDRLGHVGDARRAAPPPVLEGALLDGARPRREARAAARRLCQDRGVGGRARRDPRRRARARLERAEAGVRAVVRLRRARRRAAAHADPRLPAGDRRAHALDDRGDRVGADRGRPRSPLSQRRGSQRRRPDRRGGHVRDLLVLARLVPGEGG